MGNYNGEYASEYCIALNELNIGSVLVKGQKTDGHLVEYVGPGRAQRLGMQFVLWDFCVSFDKKLLSLTSFKRALSKIRTFGKMRDCLDFTHLFSGHDCAAFALL